MGSTPGTLYVWIDMDGPKWTYCPMEAFSWTWMGRTWPSRKCSGGCLRKRTPCVGGSDWSHLFPSLVQDCLIFNTQPFSRLTRRREKQLVDPLNHLLSSLIINAVEQKEAGRALSPPLQTLALCPVWKGTFDRHSSSVFSKDISFQKFFPPPPPYR